MPCVDNLDRIAFNRDLVYRLSKLYTFKGKDFYYEDVLKSDLQQIINMTIEKDTIFASKILGLNVSDQRLKLIVKKNSEPKNKQEMVVANLKKIFKIIQDKGEYLELTSNEFLQLAVKAFDGVIDIGYDYKVIDVEENLLTTKKRISKRETIDEYLRKFKKAINELHVEPTQVITSFYIDILHEKFFSQYNDFIGLLMLYALLFSQRFNVFKHISFFEAYYNKNEEMKIQTAASGLHWEYGFCETQGLNNLIIEILLKGYEDLQNYADNFLFERQNENKKDNVAGVIMKLPKVFTKEDIKKEVPTISVTTIQRALTQLRDEGKIRPTGTGRSAKWMRIVEEEMFTTRGQQMDIFAFVPRDDNNK